jgi:hypothetical protein
MAIDYQNVLISLNDALTLVKDCLGEYSINVSPNVFNEYMSALLRDIFPSDKTYGLCVDGESTKLLISCGLEADVAESLTTIVFLTVTDAISAVIPNIDFSSKHSFRMINQTDLLISKNKQ